MAAAGDLNKKTVFTSDVDLLLHPELLSQDFMQLVLSEVSQMLEGNAKYVFWARKSTSNTTVSTVANSLNHLCFNDVLQLS